MTNDAPHKPFRARTSRVMQLTALALLNACGSTGGSGAGASPVPVTVSAQQGGSTGSMPGMTMMVGAAGQTARIRASRAAVWAKLPAAYESLGLPLSFKEDARFRLGNDQIKARRAIKGVQMRTILDCGSDLNGEKAESYEIKLTIESTVSAVPDTDAADITTIVSGFGRSPNFGNSDVPCSTKGELERRILNYVKLQLALADR